MSHTPPPQLVQLHAPVVARLIEHVRADQCCALLSPRYFGKSEIFTVVRDALAHDAQYHCLTLNLNALDPGTQGEFFVGLARQLQTQQSADEPLAQTTLPATMTSAELRGWLAQIAAAQKRDLVLFVDHLENAPTDLARALLTCLRAAFMEQRGAANHLIPLIASASSLAHLAVGETSPFYRIAQTLFVPDLDDAQSRTLLDAHIATHRLSLTPSAYATLARATASHPHLIQLFCAQCAHAGKRITHNTTATLLRQFLADDACRYGPFTEAVRLIEQDANLLNSVLLLLEKTSMPIRDLPLGINPDIDPLYLTGVVIQKPAGHYQLRNQLYRDFLAAYFHAGRVGRTLAMAGRWDAAIESFAKSAAERTNYRADVLPATIQAMYAAEDMKHGAHFLARGLRVAFGMTQVGIWLVEPDGQWLTELFHRDASGEGIQLPRRISLMADGLEARAYREKYHLRGHGEEAAVEWALPLVAPDHRVIGVVVLGHADHVMRQREQELELHSYLKQAARALREISLRRGQLALPAPAPDEHARYLTLLRQLDITAPQLETLDQIFQLILTAVTAHFGLGFNRAWLFLLEREKMILRGHTAIGDWTRELATETWRTTSQLTLDDYLLRLARGEIAPSPLHARTRELAWSVSATHDDPFARAITQRQVLRWSRTSPTCGPLPSEFQRAFNCEAIIVAPLLARGECWGVIVGDNKFNDSPISPNAEQTIATLANLTAAAIVTQEQREQAAREQKLEETLRDLLTQLVATRDMQAAFDRVLAAMGRVIPFDSASIQLFSPRTQKLAIRACHGFAEPNQVQQLEFPLTDEFPNSQVFLLGQSQRYPDVRETFPQFADPKFHATHVRGWLGVPLVVNAKPIGVITLDRANAVAFSSEDQRLAALFADQAALQIERAREFERERQEKKLLRDIDQLITAGEDLPPIWELIRKRFMELTDADNGSISVLNDDSEQLECVDASDDTMRVSHRVGDASIVGQVARQKRALLIRDIFSEADERNAGCPDHLDTRAILAVPVLRDEHLSSVISLESPRANAFDDADQDFLQALALQAGIALRLAEKQQAMQNQVRRARLMLDAEQRITDFRPLRDQLYRFATRLKHNGNYDTVTIFPYRPNRQEFDLPISVGEFLAPVAVGPVKRGSLLWKLVDSSPPEHFSSDPANDSWLKSQFVTREGIRASGFVRLVAHHKTVGVLFVNRRSEHVFSNAEKRRVTDMAKQIAEAIWDSNVLQRIVDNLARAMNFDVVTLFVYNSTKRELSRPVIGGKLEQEIEWGSAPKGGIVWRAWKQASTHFVSDAAQDPVLNGEFVRREKIRAAGYVHLRVQEKPVGVLFVNWRRAHAWTPDEIDAVKLFAHQAALAIQNERHFNEHEEDAAQLRALRDAGQTITRAGLELARVLQAILDQAALVTDAYFGTIQLIEGDSLEFAVAYPPERKAELITKYGRMRLDGPGITALAVRAGKAQLVADVTNDARFVGNRDETKSELAVVLFDGTRPIGVLNVEHREIGGLEEKDRYTLIGLANLAQIALQNARQFKELEKTRDSKIAAAAVAWLGLFGADWQHTVNQKAFATANYANALRIWLRNHPDAPPEVFQTLEGIERLAQDMRTQRFASQLPNFSPRHVQTPTEIDTELPKMIEPWRYSRRDVKIEWQLKCPGAHVRIAPQWLKVAMEKLVNNALKAMEHGGTLTLATKIVGGQVHLTIKDTGKGIPDFARRYFLKEIVPRGESEEGSGMGALIARFIVENLGGDLELVESVAGKGTTLLMKLPIAVNLNPRDDGADAR